MAGPFTRLRGAGAALLVLSWVPGGPASAQEGASVRIGETRVVPALEIGYTYYDNVFRTPDEPVDGNAFYVSPSVSWNADRRLLDLSVSYDGRFQSGSEDTLDFNEHALQANVAASPTSKWRLNAEAFANQQSDERDVLLSDGETVGQLRSDTRRIGLGANATYGASTARGNVTAGFQFRHYDPDNPDGALNDRRSDSQIVEPYGRLSLRISPDTRVVLEGRYATVDFGPAEAIDQQRFSALVGIDRAASGISGGGFRIGYTTVDFDRSDLDSTDTLRASVNLYYLPASFSRFDLSFSRDFDERVSFGGESNREVVLTQATLGWRYDWSSRFTHSLKLGVQQTDRDCPDISEREVSLDGRFSYNVRRWLGVGIRGGYIDRTGDVCNDSIVDSNEFEFDALNYGLFLRATL